MNKKGQKNISDCETLTYRKCLSYLNYILVFLFLISFVLFLLSLIGFFQIHNYDHKMAMSLIVNAGFFGMFCALFFSLWKFNLNAALKAKINIYDNSILFTDTQKEYSIYFEDLAGVSVVSFFGVSRIVLRKEDGGLYSYSIWLNGVEKILDAIYTYDKKLIPENKYDLLKKRMILGGQNIERLENFFSKKMLLNTLAHLLVLPIVFFFILLWKQNSINIFSKLDYYLSSVQPFIFITIITSTLYFIFSNMHITKYMIKNKSDDIDSSFRDFENEKHIFSKYYPWYVGCLVVLLSSVILFDANFYGIMKVSKGSVPLNLLKGDRVWIDKRYNCFSCKYGLQENDVIVYIDKESKKRAFGKVTTLSPGFSRVPASIRDKGKTLIVLSGQSQEEEFITYSQIIGKKL